MKLDNILLVVVGVIILLILLGLGIGVLMLLSGGEENGGGTQPNTVIKYQCFDGSVVSKVSDCPKVSTKSSSVSTVATVASSQAPVSCPKCDCITRPTTSPPTTLCIHCSSASGCGQAYSNLSCKSGDVLESTFTPKCTNGCCIWESSSNIKAICTSDQICQDGACVTRPPDEEE